MLTLWRRNGKGNWIIRGTVAGQRVHQSTGTDKRRLAEAAKTRLENELLERSIYGRPATVTFAEATLTYLESGGEGRFLRRVLEYAGPDTLLKDIDNDWLNRAARELYPDAAPATVNRQLITPVSAVVTLAAEDGLCEFRRFRRRSAKGGRIRWLTPEEAERLIEAIREMHPHILRPVAIMLGGSARSAEALKLQIPDLHLATGEAFIREPKNGADRMIQFPARAVALITETELPEIGPVCLTPKGKPYVIRANGGGQIAGAFNACREAAGLGRDVTPHVLRHTWATWFYAQTRDFGRLMDLGGWKKADMANHYRKLAPEDLGDRLAAHGWDFTRAEFRRPAVRPGARPELRAIK